MIIQYEFDDLDRKLLQKCNAVVQIMYAGGTINDELTTEDIEDMAILLTQIGHDTQELIRSSAVVPKPSTRNSGVRGFILGALLASALWLSVKSTLWMCGIAFIAGGVFAIVGMFLSITLSELFEKIVNKIEKFFNN